MRRYGTVLVIGAMLAAGIGVRTLTVGGLSATVTGLAPDTAYTFTVVALDRSFNPSPPSAPVVDRTLRGESEPPSTPQNVRVTTVAPPCVTIVWDPSVDNVGVVGYDVTRDSDPPVTVTTPTVIDISIPAA